MKKGNSDPLPPALAAELAALETMPDDTIDTSEMPEVQDWSGAQRGHFYKPRKVQKTLRIDVDVLAWFEAQRPGTPHSHEPGLACSDAHGTSAQEKRRTRIEHFHPDCAG
jgi:uncharacterized protein (DUF4415 family)